ncbi:MAG: dual specificity protein phosphatase family protein [Bdellovibrionales bacterium]
MRRLTALYHEKKTYRYGLRFLGSVVLFLLIVGIYCGYLYLTGNFHEVLPGLLYRSSQPTPEQIAAYKAKYDIQSIVNLRGDNTGSPWYDQEVAESKRLGIQHFNFRMSARRQLSQEQAQELIAILRKAPKPLLVHCVSGADRTGLASALYLAAIAQKGEEASEDQMSLVFGHVAIPYLSSAFAMDETFEKLEEWLGFPDS